MVAVLVGGLVAVAAGPAEAADTAQTARHCDTIRLGSRTHVFYRGGGVTCRFARRWIKRLYESRGRRRPPGYICTSGTRYRNGGNCATRTRSKYFGWHPAD